MRLLKLFALLATVTAAAAGAAQANANLLVVLRPTAGGPATGGGVVVFRQPIDANKIVFLDVGVFNLLPNHSYRLQRAVDPNVDDNCTGTNWLTLGKGLVPEAITTDDRGFGRASLFRDLSAVPTGTKLDIHFRVIDDATSTPVLQSACYLFTVTQ
jgi:hypothetical protein